jgi:hypothetical protein
MPSIDLLIAADWRSSAFLACLRCQNHTIVANTMPAIANRRKFKVWVTIARDSDMCWVAISASGCGRAAVSTNLGRLFSRNSVSVVSTMDCGAKVQGRNSTEVSVAVRGEASAAVRGEISVNPSVCDDSEGSAANAGILGPSEVTKTKTDVPAESESGTYDVPKRVGVDIEVWANPIETGAADSIRSGIETGVVLRFEAGDSLGT